MTYADIVFWWVVLNLVCCLVAVFMWLRPAPRVKAHRRVRRGMTEEQFEQLGIG